ncbi:MAG: hypothetical protein RL220_2014 [Bacteroidota bacterium]|jgi:hypothetical protein
MKKTIIPNPLAISLKVVFTAALLMVLSFSLFAKEPPTGMARLSQEIARDVQYPDFLKAEGEKHDQLVKVTVAFNSEGVISVENVDSGNSQLNEYVKEKLNGRKLEVESDLIGKPLTFSIKFNLI